MLQQGYLPRVRFKNKVKKHKLKNYSITCCEINRSTHPQSNFYKYPYSSNQQQLAQSYFPQRAFSDTWGQLGLGLGIGSWLGFVPVSIYEKLYKIVQ